MKYTVKFAFLLLLNLFLISAASGQTASISGTVTDANGAAVSQATVTLSAQTSGAGNRRTTVSDAEGAYRFENVADGVYVLRVEASGFALETRENIRVEGGAAAAQNLDFTLRVGEISAQTVVTASRGEEELKDAPASVSVVTRREIEEKGIRYAGYELVGQPSVFVPKFDEGAYTAVTIRGVPNRHHNDTFLALVDGIPFVTPDDEIQLEFIPIDIVERVELVRGPTSALYGRGGIAGAVNYLTRAVPETKGGTFGLQYGSYNFVRPNFTYSFPVVENKNFLFFNGNFEHKDGWRDRTQRNAGNFLIKNQWNINNRFALTSYANYNRYRQGIGSFIPVREDGTLVEVTGGRTANYNVENSFYGKESWMAATALNTVFTPNVNLRTTVHYRQSDNDFNGGFNDGFNEEFSTISWNGFRGGSKNKTFYVEPQLSWTTKRFRFVSGANYENIRNRNTSDWTGEYGFNPATFEFLFYIQKRNYRTGAFTNRAAWRTDRLEDAQTRVNVGSAYAQGQIDITSKLFATIGARFDYFNRRVDYAATNTVSGFTPASTVADSDSHVSPKVSVSYRFTPNTTAYVSYGEGFSPGFGPIFSFNERNSNLKPEIARNYEIGFRGDIFNRRLFFSATAYRLQRKDLILLISNGNLTRTVNVGEQQSSGFEFESKFNLDQINEGLSGFFNYSYTDSVWKNNRFAVEFSNEIRDYTGKKVRGVPPHLFSAGVGKTFRNGVSVRGWLDFVGDYFTDPENTIKAGRHGLLNASLTIPFADRRFELTFTGTNLLNTKYFYWTGYSIGPQEAYPGQPLQITGGFRYRF